MLNYVSTYVYRYVRLISFVSLLSIINEILTIHLNVSKIRLGLKYVLVRHPCFTKKLNNNWS